MLNVFVPGQFAVIILSQKPEILCGLLNICVISSSEIQPDWSDGGTEGK